jgi:hypothetical protein
MIGGNVSEHPSAGLTFGFDVASLEQLMPVLPNLLEQLARQLRGRDQVAVQVLVRLVTSLRPRNIRVRPSRPSRSGERLLRLIRVRLEDMKLSSPVTEIHVEVEEVAPEPAWQPGLTDRSEMREPLPTVVDRLREALGEGTVFTAEMADRWRPEASWGQSQVLPQHGLFSTKRREVDDGDPVLQQEKLERALGRPRPLVLLPSPIPLEARIDAQGMPTSVLLDSGWVAVGDCEGPERLQGEWWEDDGGFDRDYFAVAVRNGTAWLFRDAERWFLHGWFD